MLMKYENGFENSIREFRHGCAHTNSQNRHLLFADCPCSDIKRSEFDLTGLFWTKLCEKLSLERSFGHAEEEV